MSPLVARLLWSAGALVLAAALGFGSGWHFGGLEAEADKAKLLQEIAEGARDVANKARTASEAFRKAEQTNAQAMYALGLTYEQEKFDAGQAGYSRAVADVRAGKLRHYWRCSVPTASQGGAAASGSDDAADLREAGIGRVLSIVAQCDAHVTAAQAVIQQYLQSDSK